MDIAPSLILFSLLSLAIGMAMGFFLQKFKNNKFLEDTKKEAKELLDEARRDANQVKGEKMLQAKERFIELRSEHEKLIFNREKKISELENRNREKENMLNKDINRNKNLYNSLEQKNELLQTRLNKLEIKQKEIDKNHEIHIQKLEAISGITAADAKEELFDSLKKKVESEATAFAKQSLDEAKLTVEQEAKKIIIATIQRIGTEEAIENCVSVFNLDSDDVKGRIMVVREETYDQLSRQQEWR